MLNWRIYWHAFRDGFIDGFSLGPLRRWIAARTKRNTKEAP